MKVRMGQEMNYNCMACSRSALYRIYPPELSSPILFSFQKASNSGEAACSLEKSGSPLVG